MTVGRRRWIAALVAALLSAGAQPAAASIPQTPEPTVRLPGDVHSAADGSKTWIVGARDGAAAIARRHGARALRLDDTYVIARGKARAFADELRRAGLLSHAEPDVVGTTHSAFDATPFAWARGAVVAPNLVPPAPTARIGVLDTYADETHPDLAGHLIHLPGPANAVTHPHGTMVSSAAAAAFNASGVTGIYPGAQIVNYGVTEDLRCSDSVNGIRALAAESVSVIVASYGFTEPCFAEYEAIAIAYGVGTMVVAAAGNEFQEGNPVNYPAAWPHVLSVGVHRPGRAVVVLLQRERGHRRRRAGRGRPARDPRRARHDRRAQDGLTLGTGTSFSAPIVAGAVAWLRTARPEVSNGQAADLLRRTATDNGPPGWDRDNGYGLINLQAALTAQVPRIDPLEPNDSIAEINGTVFSQRGRPDLERPRAQAALRLGRLGGGPDRRLPRARARAHALEGPRASALRHGRPGSRDLRRRGDAAVAAVASASRAASAGEGRVDSLVLVNRRRVARHVLRRGVRARRGALLRRRLSHRAVPPAAPLTDARVSSPS